MWVCTRHPSALLTAFPAFSSTGGTGKCHYLFRGQGLGFHASHDESSQRGTLVNCERIRDKEYVFPAETPSPQGPWTPRLLNR